jgi:LysM repeat protein
MVDNKPTWAFKVIFLVLLATSILTACNIGDLSLPSTLPHPKTTLNKEHDPASPSITITDESPRQGPEIDLPPTWTPVSADRVETPVAAPERSTGTSSSSQSYIVQEGDTLAEIAIQFGVTLDALTQINNISDQDHIEVGQELVIPAR